MERTQINNFGEYHFDFDHLRPITNKDLQQFSPAERSYIQAHHYAINLQSNKLI
ncbi:hypothetical protein [Secundilactobacillus yichangensis]|uniref:hypothetical protein n=1 Tax=Secundilactobacillus yichangensis TaxID=2799580 RepID=UPI001943941D|nr:hypothetical protein [Secundilactobacillus yichangensis]